MKRPESEEDFESDVAYYDAMRTDEELADRLAEPLFTGAVGGRAELVALITGVNIVIAVWVAVAVFGTELGTGWFWIPAVTVANALTLWVGAGVFFAIQNVRAALWLRPVYKQLITQRRAQKASEENGRESA